MVLHLLYNHDVTFSRPVNIIKHITKKEEQLMKVVVIRSPKFLSGILRVIFKIKKEECE